MPRRVSKDVFNLGRSGAVDQPSQDSAAPPLGALLPRLDAPVAAGASPAADTSPMVADEGPPAATQEASRPRGTGGRLGSAAAVVGNITPVAARVPSRLYEAALPMVKGVAKPSWGQLVAWTCQDQAEDVHAEVNKLAAAVAEPRRLRGHNREGEAGLQVTARLTPGELEALDDVRTALQASVDVRLTRTMVVVAALTVAVRRPG